jgi:signal transduction histidine kinase
MIMSQRILGPEETRTMFRREAVQQGIENGLPEPTPAFLERLERELAASIGAAAAHAMVAQLVGRTAVSVEDLLAVADESAQILEYSNTLERQSAELTRTARKLREANEKLTALSVQKDAFLSQISHELRTPMTSIRAFSEILREDDGAGGLEQKRYATIIHDESLRLTRLLDDLLDLSVLENGQVSLNLERGKLSDAIDKAVLRAKAAEGERLVIQRHDQIHDLAISTDLDRLGQVFLNLITNAQKYCDADTPELQIRVENKDGRIGVVFADNGTPIPSETRSVIFEKFVRIDERSGAGAGLGLAICREIMARLGGDITFETDGQGNQFVVWLPEARALAAQ